MSDNAEAAIDMHTCDVVQYVKWANKTDLDDFWTDPKVKRLFKNHIYAMTSRTNVYNGEPQAELKVPHQPCFFVRVLCDERA